MVCGRATDVEGCAAVNAPSPRLSSQDPSARATAQTTPHMFVAFDALRGMAAIMIVLWHLGFLIEAWQPKHGYLAVDLFFVMSGFVIAHAYEHRLKAALALAPSCASASCGSTRSMLWAPWSRACRPPQGSTRHFIGAPYSGRSRSHRRRRRWRRAAISFPYNNVGWSLFLEIVVNAVYALTWRLSPAGAAAAGRPCRRRRPHRGDRCVWQRQYGLCLAQSDRRRAPHRLRLSAGRSDLPPLSQGRCPAHAPLALLLGAPLPFLRWGPAGGAGVAWELFGMMIVMPLVAALAVRARTPDRLITISSLGAAS